MLGLSAVSRERGTQGTIASQQGASIERMLIASMGSSALPAAKEVGGLVMSGMRAGHSGHASFQSGTG